MISEGFFVYLCMKEYEKTKIGILKRMYDNQKHNSIKRGHPEPSYSKNQFIEWVLSQNNYEKIYNNWVNSNFSKNLVPSVDRIISSEPYSFNNIRLMTWKENELLAQKEKSKSVQLTNLKTLEKSVFPSLRKAALSIKASHSNLIKVISGNRKTVKGHTVKYT